MFLFTTQTRSYETLAVVPERAGFGPRLKPRRECTDIEPLSRWKRGQTTLNSISKNTESEGSMTERA